MPAKNTKTPETVTREVRRAISQNLGGIDSMQFLLDILDEWGGTKALARDLMIEFKNARPGGMTRQSILEMIQRLLVFTTQANLSASSDPAELDDEDLQLLVKNLVGKASDA
jgi:hypothetical protein